MFPNAQQLFMNNVVVTKWHNKPDKLIQDKMKQSQVTSKLYNNQSEFETKHDVSVMLQKRWCYKSSFSQVISAIDKHYM